VTSTILPVDAEMVAVAAMIIKRRAGHFDPKTLRDRHQEALRELIEAEMKGFPIKLRIVAPPAILVAARGGRPPGRRRAAERTEPGREPGRSGQSQVCSARLTTAPKGLAASRWPGRRPTAKLGGDMPPTIDASASADVVAHIIQVALAPVFLLSGIATLLSVFSTRLARVADRVEQLMKALEDADEAEAAMLGLALAGLRRRSIALDVAVVLGAIGAAATCASVLALFVGALKNETAASVLFTTFGVAVASTLGAIAAFTVEMLMAGSGVRAEVSATRRPAAPQ